MRATTSALQRLVSLGTRTRLLLASALVVVTAVSSAQPSQHPLIGTFRLARYAPHGDEPIGMISYDAAGRMWAMIFPPGREPLSRDSAPEAYRDTMRGVIAYYGTYDIDEAAGRVVHHVEAASNPAWIGDDFVRWFRFEGENRDLVISLNERFDNPLLWERLPDEVAAAEASAEQAERAIASLRGGRIPKPASYDALTEAQRAYVHGILAGPRNDIPPPLAALLPSPELGDLVQRAVAYARFAGNEGGASVPPKLNELAILMAARTWRGEYVWHAHHDYAVRVGLRADVVEAVRAGRRPADMEPDVEAVYRLLDEMIREQRVSDATLAAAREVLGDRGVVDLVGTFALYSLSSMLVMVDESPLPAGVEPYFAPLR